MLMLMESFVLQPHSVIPETTYLVLTSGDATGLEMYLPLSPPAGDQLKKLQLVLGFIWYVSPGNSVTESSRKKLAFAFTVRNTVAESVQPYMLLVITLYSMFVSGRAITTGPAVSFRYISGYQL